MATATPIGPSGFTPQRWVAAVDLEPDPQAQALEVGGHFEGDHGVRVVDQHADPNAGALQLGHLRDTCRGDGHRVGDVGKPRPGERPRLGQGRHRDRPHSPAVLQPGDLDALVGLDVGTKAHAQTSGPLPHAGEVGAQPRKVHHRSRSPEVPEVHLKSLPSQAGHFLKDVRGAGHRFAATNESG